ncbi:MAG: MBL fold metallo-hydrolase [Acidobacteria bacterium]|nr:MBL fold metallo-hydrolase [Acidobacteriota bacterium]
MRIRVLGKGDAFTALHNHTCFLVRGVHDYLVDVPPAILRVFGEHRVDVANVERVILTHLHGDHSAGLETLMLWKKYVQKGKLRLYTSADVFREFREKFFPRFADSFSADLERVRTSELSEYLDWFELPLYTRTRLDGEIEIEIRQNWHPTPTLGLKLISPDGIVSISGDTCYRPSLLERLRQKGLLQEEPYQYLSGNWLWDADIIYHEAALEGDTVHTWIGDLLQLPPAIQKKIRLVHVSDDLKEQKLQQAREGEVVYFAAPRKPEITKNSSRDPFAAD